MEFRFDKKSMATSFGLTAVFNTVIALFLTLLGFGEDLGVNFIFSQSIGLCICSFILAGHVFVRQPSVPGHVILFLITIPAGAAAGTFVGAKIAGISFTGILLGRPALFIQMIFLGVLFGVIISYFFFSREKISHTEAQLQEERIRSLTLEKHTLQIRLKLLQAQIEPHFLFNTLSNILSLLDSDPARGKDMLHNLTRYLRSSLSRTRDQTTTLGQEMDQVRAYLEIHKVRMGDRLRYTIQFPEALRDRPLPPMLVQPLVENALKHGLEPLVEGGLILVNVEDNAHTWRIEVADTGPGLTEAAGEGVGLSNVRERLEALFPGKGRLFLEENRPTGLKATVEIPHE